MSERETDAGLPFTRWHEGDSTLGEVIAIDTETTLIDKGRPWIAPTLVLAAAYDGKRGYFMTRETLEAFLEHHRDCHLVLHNAAFDLDVIATCVGSRAVYDRVEKACVWDTLLLHRLYCLATNGGTGYEEGGASLEACAQRYLGMQLPKDHKDSGGKVVRHSYERWLHRPYDEIEAIYLEYLAKDVVATFGVFHQLQCRIKATLQASSGEWGYVSESWLRECICRYGPLTHHVQLKAAVVLRDITARGMRLDTARREELAAGLQVLLDQSKEELRKYGYNVGCKESDKAVQSILREMEREYRVSFPRTNTGKIMTQKKVLCEFQGRVPFVRDYLHFQESKKLLGCFVGKLAKSRVHPDFDVLLRTGRTSSYGDINAQGLPKRDDVRNCFIPEDGCLFVDADYATIELATLAQACMSQFGLESKMAEAINRGDDLHTLLAARVLGKDPEEVTKADRGKAKAINFGKPGGMGDAAVVGYAKSTFAVDLSLEEAGALSATWVRLFPEMVAFKEDGIDVPLRLARLLGLTPDSYARATNRRLRTDEILQPSSILGAMLIKVVGHENPSTSYGREYSEAELAYFWGRVQVVQDQLPAEFHEAVEGRVPSKKLQQAVNTLVGLAGVFTLSGRLRANAKYTARHNTVFQGLAADGAKLALWHLWREGFRIVNFIHDQVLVEVPAETAQRDGRRIRDIMVESMKTVVPDVRISVTAGVSDRWCEKPEPMAIVA